MSEIILENEILKLLFDRTGFSITRVGTESEGLIAIYKRTYENCSMHFGTLVDLLNNPEKQNEVNMGSNNILYWKEKVTRENDIQIKNFEYYKVSDAIELMVFNEHIYDTAAKVPVFADISHRQITLIYNGAIAYLNGFYLKEHKKTQLEKIEEERVNLDVDRLRNEFFDYPITKRRANSAFYISIIMMILAAITVLITIIKGDG